MSEFLTPFLEPIELPMQDFRELADDLIHNDLVNGIKRFQEDSSCVNIDEIKLIKKAKDY